MKRLIEATKAGGMNAVALTDHGGMYGSIEFYKAAKAAGIKPILGVEGYLAPSLEEKTGRYEYNHLLLLARNKVGYHNLLKLTTIAHTRGYHYRPRVDKKVLAAHAEGLIVTSGCLSGEIPELLLKGDLNGARAAARWYQDVFGPENFYIEVQDHQAPDRRRSSSTRCSTTSAARPACGSSPPTTCTTSPRRTPRRRTSCSACRRARRSTIPSA